MADPARLTLRIEELERAELEHGALLRVIARHPHTPRADGDWAAVLEDLLSQRGTETSLLSLALRAICLTRDYVGSDLLPAIKGWEWHDAGVEISAAIPEDEWAREFRKRIETPRDSKTERGTETCGNLEQRAEANRTLFEQQRDKADALEAFLEREGYRSCDIPACNCGSFHKVERRPEAT